jgi:hypothetical protein
VVEEVVQHVGLRVDGCVYLHQHALKLINPALDLSDPLHRVFFLVHPVTDIPLKGVVPVGELGRGGGSSSVAWPKDTVRIV